MNKWVSHNRHKTKLLFHLIFVCKYRKPFLINPDVDITVKTLSRVICDIHHVIIHQMETDKDHIHYLIETPPTIAISDLVRLLKSYTTHHLWQQHSNYLTKYLWKEHTFWTDGYFAASVGTISSETIQAYIANQG